MLSLFAPFVAKTTVNLLCEFYQPRFSRKIEAMGNICIDGQIDRQRYILYYEELAHEVMEAKKFHNQLSTGCRDRKAGGVIQPKSEGLRMRGVNGVSSNSRAGEDEIFQLKQ